MPQGVPMHRAARSPAARSSGDALASLKMPLVCGVEPTSP